MKKELKEYRDHIVLAEKDAQQEFDKAVFALSGGAIGISFAFVTDIVDPKVMVCTGVLIAAWSAWAVSLICVLLSYFFSGQALRRTIQQIDKGTLYDEPPGGLFDVATSWLNMGGGLLFVLGLLFMIVFVNSNLGV